MKTYLGGEYWMLWKDWILYLEGIIEDVVQRLLDAVKEC